jgi:hypothetical protein
VANQKRISVPLPLLAGAGVAVALLAGFAGYRALFSGSDPAPYAIDAALIAPVAESRLLENQVACPDGGRSSGEGEPLARAVFEPGDDAVEAVVAPGQVVAFEFLVTASDAAPAGAIDFEVAWPKQTDQERGFDAERGVVCAFVDPSDPSAREVGGTQATAQRAALPPTQREMRADIAVQGLDPGDAVVVELWVTAPPGILDGGGALKARIGETSADGGRAVDVVRDEIGFRLSSFDRQVEPELTVDIDDSQRGPENTIVYRLRVTNPSQALVPAARLDLFPDKGVQPGQWVIADAQGVATVCSNGTDGRIGCVLGFVNPGEDIQIDVPVTVSPGATRAWSVEDGECGGQLVDLCTRAVLAWSRGPGDEVRQELDEPADLPSGNPLDIAKLVPVGPYAYPGSEVEFTYRVTNGAAAGSFAQLRVTDTKCDPIEGPTGDLNSNGRLDPGESWDYRCTSQRMNEELANSESRVEAIDDAGQPVFDVVNTQIKLINPELGVTVSAVPETPGTRLITVAATGNAGLEAIAVLAPVCTAISPTSNGNGDDRLDADGERWTFTCTADAAADVVVWAYGTDDLRNAVVGRSDQEALDAATTTTTR